MLELLALLLAGYAAGFILTLVLIFSAVVRWEWAEIHYEDPEDVLRDTLRWPVFWCLVIYACGLRIRHEADEWFFRLMCSRLPY